MPRIFQSALLTLALTTLLSTRSRRRSVINSLRWLAYFDFYDGASVMRTGLSASNVGILLAGTLLAFGVAAYLFQRRDVGL
ncbi:MAG: hypothetical protein HXY40_09565 [Chloroflexi bacterium]|nr:hypothetical protein [Chloroflexota bacterium]